MPVLQSARWLFSGGAPPPKQKPPWDPEKHPIMPLVARGKENDHPGPKRSKRKWRPPRPVDEIREALGVAGKRTSCCKRIRCLDRFAASGNASSGLYSLDLLTLEQERMAELGMEIDRKAFVSERVPILPLVRGTMFAANSPVCNYAFTALFGVSDTLIGAVKGNPGARASSFTSRTLLSAEAPCRKRRDVVSFLDRFATTYGQHMPNSDLIYCYMHDKKELWVYYIDEKRHLHRDDASALNDASCTYGYFTQVWGKLRPKIQWKPLGTFMKCGICTGLKEKIHGQAGCRGLQDSALRQECQEEYAGHLKGVGADRQVISDVETAALTAKADGRPQDTVYMSCDAANQTVFALPMQHPPTHGGDKGWPERQKMYAVLVEGQSMNVYFTPQILGTGSNLVCTTIYMQLMTLYVKSGTTLGEVYIQVDNTVAENKNNFLMAFLGAMVARMVMRSVTVLFMQVGHTHIKIDQAFSCFAKAAKGWNIFTRSQLGSLLKKAYKYLPVRCETLKNLGNFKGLVRDVVRKIPYITHYRAFRIEMEGPAVVVAVKKFMHEEHWLGFSDDGKQVGTGEGYKPHRLFYAGMVRLEGTPAYTLKTVDEHTIHQIVLRQQASHSRLAASFPGDTAHQLQVKQEQAQNISLLESTGSRNFDLDTDWLPEDKFYGAAGELSGDSDDSDDGVDPAGSDHESSDEEDESCQIGGRLQGHAPKKKMPTKEPAEASGLQDVAVGSFALFVVSGAPFLVGKVEGEREGDGGERDVLLHWYTPSKALLKRAETVDFDTYGKAVFNAAYLVEEVAAGPGRGRATKNYNKDTEWEPARGVAATCSALNHKGKRIPRAVLNTLKASLLS